MTNPKPPRTTSAGTFQFRRGDKVQRFVCDRCTQTKVSRIQVDWTTADGHRKVICNACYGLLLSRS